MFGVYRVNAEWEYARTAEGGYAVTCKSETYQLVKGGFMDRESARVWYEDSKLFGLFQVRSMEA